MATQGKKLVRTPRERRKLRIRKNVTGTVEKPRLSIFRSSKHMYAQLIIDGDHKTVVAASTLDKEVQAAIAKLASKEEGDKKSTKSVLAARAALCWRSAPRVRRSVRLCLIEMGSCSRGE
jgi:large subunit ribosomal protein L18